MCNSRECADSKKGGRPGRLWSPWVDMRRIFLVRPSFLIRASSNTLPSPWSLHPHTWGMNEGQRKPAEILAPSAQSQAGSITTVDTIRRGVEAESRLQPLLSNRGECNMSASLAVPSGDLRHLPLVRKRAPVHVYKDFHSSSSDCRGKRSLKLPL